MKILFCASEVAPFVKTGGLADVAGSLPLALGELDVQTVILMPRVRGIRAKKEKLSKHVSIHFIENESFFNRAGVYGNERGDYHDNLQRFSFFCNAALSLTKEIGFKPDVVHANDWQTALLPVLLKTRFSSDAFFKKTKSLLTVHNLAYQGQFPGGQFKELGLDDPLFSVEGFEFYGKVNLLKAGLIFADRVNTVSPTYAEEIKTREFGFGLDGVIRSRTAPVRGILNGIDTGLWNPATDKKIRKRYSRMDLSGKEACKASLQKSCGFQVAADVPVFGMVTRLAEQKGLELVSEIADKFLSQKVQFVLLGQGDGVYHTTFLNIGKRHPKNSAIYLGFDAAEAHRIYAGADFFLMPSYFEPCGLGQMISLRYGTIPVVRKTGGLADTVADADRDPQAGNGFLFEERVPEKLLDTIERAIAAFQNKKRFETLRRRAMKADFSWRRSAIEYKKFYSEALRS